MKFNYRIIILQVFAIFGLNQIFASDFAEGCFTDKWVATKVKYDQNCPKAQGFKESSTFERSDQTQNSELNLFCTYEKEPSTQVFQNNRIKKNSFRRFTTNRSRSYFPFVDDNRSNTDGYEGIPVPYQLQRLVSKGLLSPNLKSDCASIGSQAGNVATDVAKVLHKQFHLQSGKYFLSPISQNLYPVRMSIIDTLQTTEHKPWLETTNSSHGLTLASLANNLLCDQGSEKCYAHLTSQLAMAYIAEGEKGSYSLYRDDLKGGYFGTISDLAKSIRKEVNTWQNVEPTSRLVLNLSLGWNGKVWGGDEQDVRDFPSPVLSVYRAIEDAVCRGALVIASAGNKGNADSSSEGALLPALWETRPAPTLERCREIIGSSSKNYKYHKSNSLVYGVSGIDSMGSPLDNARPKANSRIVAYGDHSYHLEALDLPGLTHILTGSSISAVVVSSTASAIWASRPDLNSYEVMETIYKAGEHTDFNANFHRYSSLFQVPSKRASMCSALTLACAGGMCQEPSSCEWFQEKPNLQGTSLITDPTTATYNLGALSSCSLAFDITCYLDYFSSVKSLPWTVPQPDEPQCPACTVSGTGGGAPFIPNKQRSNHSLSKAQKTLAKEIEASSSSSNLLIIDSSATFSGTISKPRLIIGDRLYTIPHFNNGDRILIKDVTLSATEKATLSVLINNAYRETIPLLISQ